MQQHDKALLLGNLQAVSSLLSAAKGAAGSPVIAGTPVVALNPLVSAVEQLQKTVKMLIEKS